MSFEARFAHGDPIMIDYTPVTAIPAGTVIPGSGTGLTSLIAHHDLEANEVGAVAAGGGVYEMINNSNSANNVLMYFDNVTKKATATATGNSRLGYIVRDGGRGVDSLCLILHDPRP